MSYQAEMFAVVLATASPEPDATEIEETGWFGPQDIATVDLAPDMTEIVPAAFEWFDRQHF